MSINFKLISRFLWCKSCASVCCGLRLGLINANTIESEVLFSITRPCSTYSPGGDAEGTKDRQHRDNVDKFAYGRESMSKKNKDAPGLLNLTTVYLPKQLQKNLQEFLKKYPKKILENDGIKLSRHLKNRGRPTEHTWKKFKEAKKALKTTENRVQVDSHIVLALGGSAVESAESIKSEHRSELEETNCSVDESEKQTQEDEAELEQDEEIESENLQGIKEWTEEGRTKKIVKKPRREEYKVIRYGKRETAAYTASRLPASYGATLRVFHEIARREPDYQPEILLDFGSGTGSAVWAAHEKWRHSIQEYQCVDISEDMNNAAEFLLRGSEGDNSPLYIPRVYFKRFLPISNKVTYDIVVASYSLSELPKPSLRKAAVANLWGKTNDFLVLVEHGNTEGFEITLEARKLVLREEFEDTVAEESNSKIAEGDTDEMEFLPLGEEEMAGGYVFAPCPHDEPCPRDDVETRDHPCNFVQRVPLAFSQRNTSLKRWSCYSERFSYIVLRKGHRDQNEETWPRILEPVRKRKRHVICKLCSSGGSVEQRILTKKKDSDVYKCARHVSQWGDLLPLPRDRIRPVKPREEAVQN